MLRRLLLSLALCTAGGCADTLHDVCRYFILPEQRTIAYRDPAQLPAAHLPVLGPPRTVAILPPETFPGLGASTIGLLGAPLGQGPLLAASSLLPGRPQFETPAWQMTLDEAIRLALENTRVVRVLTGIAAASSGRTIYDAAITNTTIDQEQARFDPVLSEKSLFNHINTPNAILDPLNLGRSLITSTPTDDYRSVLGLTKTNVVGGQWALNWTENPSRFHGLDDFPLNPQNRRALELGYTQPLLQGGGFLVNTAPIVIARLNTEQSFFQYKASVQELVRGVIEAYWSLVQARLDVRVRNFQVTQSQEAYKYYQAHHKAGFLHEGNESQSLVSYYQFRANLIAAEAAVLQREGALRNLLRLPPADGRQIVPFSAPTFLRLKPNWDELVHLAEQRRPDIVELKIIREADQVRLLQARNETLPKLDMNVLYRWNGLSGEMPNGEHLDTGLDHFGEWSVTVNFSVPLGLRQGRAQVRQQELILARDQANLDQGFHAAVHELATTVRDMASAYEQYLAYKESRAAAVKNLDVQRKQLTLGGIAKSNFLNVLQALNDLGTSVSSEGQAVLTYNVALAALEQRTGTILETHGLVFAEERFRAAGPLGCLGHGRLYPSALIPTGSSNRYPGTGKPSENLFDLPRPLEPGLKP